MENSNLKKVCLDVALQVVIEGCYYGYKIEQPTATYLQELPASYCRSRFKSNGRPVVEFNVAYFDEAFPQQDSKNKILKAFPKEIKKAYLAFKNGTLKSDTRADKG